MKIETTSITQTGNETLGMKEKKLYYLIIKNEVGNQLIVNVGEKTHNRVKELQIQEETAKENKSKK